MDLQRDDWRRVADPLGDVDDVDAGIDRHADVRVPQRMKGHIADAYIVANLAPVTGQLPRSLGPAVEAGKTNASSGSFPRRRAMRCSTCRRRCSLSVSTTISGSVTSRRPAFVFGALNDMPFGLFKRFADLDDFAVQIDAQPARIAELFRHPNNVTRMPVRPDVKPSHCIQSPNSWSPYDANRVSGISLCWTIGDHASLSVLGSHVSGGFVRVFSDTALQISVVDRLSA